MLQFDNSAKIALVTAVLFYVVGYQHTYEQTNNLFGKLVKQESQTAYGKGLTINNRGFLIHSLVVAVLMYLVLKYGLKL